MTGLSRALVLVLLVLCCCGGDLSVGAVPRNMGMDHVGVVVPNAQEATDFFVDVFDCVFDWEVRRPPLPNAGERGWDRIFDIHPLSHLPHVTMLKCGDFHLTQYLEIFQWSSPDQTMRPGGWGRFTDVGFAYVSFTVKDVDAVWAYFRELIEAGRYPGLRLVSDPMSFPLRGELCRSAFIVTPFGLWVEVTEWSESGPRGTVIHAQRTLEPTASHVHGDQEVVELRSEYISAPSLSIWEVDTPVLYVDMDIVEENTRLMAKRVLEANMSWRLVVKAHKSPRLAQRLLDLSSGASHGILTLTVDEAEVFAQYGFQDIFVAAAVASPSRLQRLGALSARISQLRVQVDRSSVAEQLAAAVLQHGGRVQVLVEVNIGHNRTGVDSVQAALEVARTLSTLQQQSDGAVRLVGVTGYEGHTPVLAPAEKSAATHAAHSLLRAARDAIAQELGVEAVPVVSGGGSSNYMDCLAEGVLTELQAGGGALTDQLYADKAGLGAHGHRIGTFVLTEVTSVAQDGSRAMADAGFKTVGWHPFAGFPRVLGRDDVEVYGMSAEHLKLRSTDPATPLALRVGERLQLAAPYLDSLAHLHSRIVVTRDQAVIDEFAIMSIRK